MKENELAGSVVDAALEVHRTLGPGLLESVYRDSLAHELELRSLACETEVPIVARYKGLQFDSAYRMDLLVAAAVVVELKAVEALLPVHKAQVLSYLRLTGKRLGLLINFNVPVLKQGIQRVVNNL